MWNVRQEKKRAESQKTRAGEPGSKKQSGRVFSLLSFSSPPLLFYSLLPQFYFVPHTNITRNEIQLSNTTNLSPLIRKKHSLCVLMSITKAVTFAPV